MLSDATRNTQLISKKLEKLCELATESHKQIQADFAAINPIMSINQKMREMGIPADAVMIDCSKTGKRVLIILHDHEPDVVHYQFAHKDRDPGEKFEQVPYDELTVETIYDWIQSYFQAK